MELDEFTKKKKPVLTGWFSKGEGRGLAWAVWEDAVSFTKKSKEGDKWIDGQRINLTNSDLERIYVRIPKWFDMTEKKKEYKE